MLDNVRLAGAFYPVVHGSSIAAPTWKAIMDRMLAGQPATPFPDPSDKVVNGEKVPITDVIGHTIADATASLQAQGFTASVGSQIYSRYRPGIVAGTNPSGQANRGTTVQLLISAGPAPAPPPAPTDTGQPPPPAGSPAGGNSGGGPVPAQ